MLFLLNSFLKSFSKNIKNSLKNSGNTFTLTSHLLQLVLVRIEKKVFGILLKITRSYSISSFPSKKGWMGCVAGTKEWKDGDKQFMQNLFENYSNQSEFHSKCLAELFYNTLNKRRTDDLFICDGLLGVLNKSKVPYLNGGLFDSNHEITTKIDFPVTYFHELLDFFGQYNLQLMKMTRTTMK